VTVKFTSERRRRTGVGAHDLATLGLCRAANPDALDVHAQVQSAAPDHADLVLGLNALATGLVERGG
jgi:hypothetical protein